MFGVDSSALAEHCQTTPKEKTKTSKLPENGFPKEWWLGQQNRVNKKWKSMAGHLISPVRILFSMLASVLHRVNFKCNQWCESYLYPWEAVVQTKSFHCFYLDRIFLNLPFSWMCAFYSPSLFRVYKKKKNKGWFNLGAKVFIRGWVEL